MELKIRIFYFKIMHFYLVVFPFRKSAMELLNGFLKNGDIEIALPRVQNSLLAALVIAMANLSPPQFHLI